MQERGGPTTQSGIFYQNSVAALYLGRLCDSTIRPASESVRQVRVEAPEHVDDVVITFGDEHTLYIQAKENVKSSDEAWGKVWRDFEKQFLSDKFRRGKDCLCFQIGNLHNQHDQLVQLCQRAAESEDYAEWEGRLNKLQSLLSKIRQHLSPELSPPESLLDFFKHVEVQIWPLRHIQQDLLPNWMPKNNRSTNELFRLLRDRVGGKARRRGSFFAQSLRQSLQDETPDLIFTNPLDIEDLRSAIKQCGSLLRGHKHTIANTSHHIEQDVVAKIVDWLVGDEENTEKNVSMLLDQAGMGKTVVMLDVLYALEAQNVDVLALKADLQVAEVASLDEMQTQLRLPHSIEQCVERLAKLGRTVVLIDQIDALSLSLAHDQKALNVVLDLVARLRRIPNVRLLISCRIFDRNSDFRLKEIQIGPQFTLSKLSLEDVKQVLDLLNINFDSLSSPTQQLLKTPLHLDLFARAISEDSDPGNQLHGISSLTELYEGIWQNVVLKRKAGSPPTQDRTQTLDLLTAYMGEKQQISTPQSLTQTSQDVEQAAQWLASAGILIQSKTNWTFLHQTFFDYCYARRFVEQGGDIVSHILASRQSILERPKLIQVMTYLQGHDPGRYLRDLQRLLNEPSLRFHLSDLLWRWFGALANPTDAEWQLAQRMLFNLDTQWRLLGVMRDHEGWFNRLSPLLESWLAEDDEFIEAQIVPYLVSLINTPKQVEIITLIQPYMGRSSQWNNRIATLLSYISSEYTIKAIELFEQVVYQVPSLNSHDIFQIEKVAKIHPPTGCRLIRYLFDEALKAYKRKQKEAKDKTEGNRSYRFMSGRLFDELGDSGIEDIFQVVSEAEPELFVEVMLPWLEQVLVLHPIPDPDETQDFFISDGLSYGWYENSFPVQYAFIHSLITALIELARLEPGTFRPIATRLTDSPYKTPQQLLTHVYRTVPEMYSEDALLFLLSDQRRLNLDEDQQYDTRQVVKAIYPYLTEEQRIRLETYILSYTPILKYLGVDELRRRGIEQFRILQAIPIELLTFKGVDQLRQWERKFPDIKVSEEPITMQSGFVGSPISLDIAKKMSDRDWLRAMQKYQADVVHKDFLKGGAEQLSPVLSTLIKENPSRFYKLFQQVPDDIDDAYVSAFINGLAEADVSAEWFFEVVRRFAYQEDRKLKSVITRAMRKPYKNGVPEDIIHLLQGWFEDVGEDEWWWSKGENHGDVYHSYLNSDRGNVFFTLMRISDNLDTHESREKKWDLIKFAAADPSTALRVGAIHELTYMIQPDRERAIMLFEELMKGHEVLLESSCVREFLYWAFYKNFLRMKPFIIAMRDHHLEDVQEQGAQLICLAALSTGALESDKAQIVAEELAEGALSGSAAWRRGAARIYSYNISRGPMERCKQKIEILLDDEDKQVRQYIDRIFFALRGEHFRPLRNIFEAYAKSEHYGLNYRFIEYLLKYGFLDAGWTLFMVETMINKDKQPNHWQHGTEELIRLVLQIYREPTADDFLKERAMDVFDKLMQKYAGVTHKVLSELELR